VASANAAFLERREQQQQQQQRSSNSSSSNSSCCGIRKENKKPSGEADNWSPITRQMIR